MITAVGVISNMTSDIEQAIERFERNYNILKKVTLAEDAHYVEYFNGYEDSVNGMMDIALFFYNHLPPTHWEGREKFISSFKAMRKAHVTITKLTEAIEQIEQYLAA